MVVYHSGDSYVILQVFKNYDSPNNNLLLRSNLFLYKQKKIVDNDSTTTKEITIARIVGVLFLLPAQ